jgi:hypothetical protein
MQVCTIDYGAPFHQWLFPLINFCFHFRTNLAPVILQLKSMGIDNVLRFDFLAVRMDDSTDVELMPTVYKPIYIYNTPRLDYLTVGLFFYTPSNV